jgi:hypothetical protein
MDHLRLARLNMRQGGTGVKQTALLRKAAAPKFMATYKPPAHKTAKLCDRCGFPDVSLS